MNIVQRVKYALIGFNGLFAKATVYTFDAVASDAVQFSLEEHGISVPQDEDQAKLVMLRACIIALGPIETISIQTPTRRRMEVGIETENRDVEKSIANLKASYEKAYDKLAHKCQDVTTFILANVIPNTERTIYTLEDMPGYMK